MLNNFHVAFAGGARQDDETLLVAEPRTDANGPIVGDGRLRRLRGYTSPKPPQRRHYLHDDKAKASV